MELRPTQVEFRSIGDRHFSVVAVYDGEFKCWTAAMCMSSNLGTATPEDAIKDLAKIAAEFIQQVEAVRP